MTEQINIPDEDDWKGYEDDLDTSYAYKLFFGKSIEEFIPLIKNNPLERADELRFVPRNVFRYYILGFAEYLMSADAKEDSDAASCFLNLLIDRETKEPGILKPVINILIQAIDRTAKNQDFYDADEDIYGKFSNKRSTLLELLKR